MKGLVRRMLPCAFAVCMAFAFASCGASGDAKYGGGGVAGDMAGDYETGAPDSAGEEEGTQERPLPQAGQLTAGEWNDNKNYEFFKSLFDKEVVAPQPDESGNVPDVLIYEENIFMPYAQDEVWGKDENAVVHHETWGMSPLRRVEVTVKGADGNPAAGASVALIAKGKTSVGAYCATKTDANGKAYLFPSLSVKEYDVIAGYGEELTARAPGGRKRIYRDADGGKPRLYAARSLLHDRHDGVYGRRTRLSASGGGRRHFPRTDGTAERGYSARARVLSGFRGRVRRQKF